MTGQVEDLELRAVGMPELDAIFDLTQVCDIADSGAADYTRVDVSAALSEKGTQAWSLVDSTGAYQACAWLERAPSRPSQPADFFVHPSQPPEVAVPLLLQLLAAYREDDGGRRMQVFISANAAAKSDLLLRHGASIVRHFFKMQISLSEPVTAISWPDGADLLDVADTDEDLRAAYVAVSEAFEDHWEHASYDFETWQKQRRSRGDYDPSLWWLVRVDGEPAAALIASEDEDKGFVATIGVRRPYRGTGLARLLLHTSFEEFRRRGLTSAALFVDSENATGAVRLYESVGMHVAAQWDCHEFPGTVAT